MCLFSPNTDALTPLRSHGTPDRAPDHLADGTPAALRDDLIALLGPTAVRGRVTDLVKYATDATKVIGDGGVRNLLNLARKGISPELLPSWVESLPMPAASKLPRTRQDAATAIYFPACINRIFGGSKLSRHKESLPAAFVTVSERAGYPLFIPPDVVGNCCATVWHSKGYNAGNILMANRVVENMWRWSKQGSLPIVCDASSCTLGLKQEVLDYLSLENRERHRALTIYDRLPGLMRGCFRS
jgi:D-lactate dehydrogenase